MEHFVIIVSGWKPLTIITKSSILDVAAVLDPPLIIVSNIKIISLFLKKLWPLENILLNLIFFGILKFLIYDPDLSNLILSNNEGN